METLSQLFILAKVVTCIISS